MKRQTITVFAVGLLMCDCVCGQIAVKSGGYYNAATGVSNEGVVCGYARFGTPYELWDSKTNVIEEIGGTGPGDGVGGRGMFSSDGKVLSGTSETEIAISQEWQRKVFKGNYLFKKVIGTPYEKFHIIGSDVSNGNGIFINGADRNRILLENFVSRLAEPVGEINSVSVVGQELFMAGEQTLAKSPQQGTTWTAMTPAAENVLSYLSIDFYDASSGVVGALVGENECAVFSTRDAGTSWVEATGFSGAIVDITHVGAIYYMITRDGKVWQSDDNGETWAKAATVANEPKSIQFYDENTGVITAVGAIYFTEDKGATWKSVEVIKGVTEQTTWNDLAWMSKDKMLLVGTKDVIYLSEDGGKTWKWENEEQSDGKTTLLSVAADANYILVSGENSTLYKKELAASMMLYQMSRYDVEKKEWKQLGFLGGISQDTSGSGYSVSGDGKTIVGFSYNMGDEYKVYQKNDNYKGFGHGVAWSEAEGFMDLGSLDDDHSKSTRCDAASEDGSVIVGYQETKYGDWTAAVWKKNPEGGYFPNEYILIDPAKGEDDLLNLAGGCDVVSSNGKWIAGRTYQDSWIWSEETGLIGLDMETSKFFYIDDEGTIAFGVRDVWTKKDGVMSLVDYLATLDIYLDDAGVERISQIQAISRNGRYLAGTAVVDGVGVTICIDLQYKGSGIQNNTVSRRISVSQNPVADCLTVRLPVGEAQLNLFDMQGRQVKTQSCATGHAEIQVSDVPEGLYILNVATGNVKETFKVQVRR